jgi:ADP-heptose:LPS heptosyltransferase
LLNNPFPLKNRGSETGGLKSLGHSIDSLLKIKRQDKAFYSMLNRLKGILYDGVLFLASKGMRRKKSKKLLIVKTDEIGDYILWRNFLQEIVSAERFHNYEIHFCGNKSWQNLFETFDQSHFQQTYWLEKIRFKKNLIYRFQFLHSIYLQGFSTVINPIFSRDKRNDDSIVRSAKSSHTIGMQSNMESVHEYENGYDKHLYTELYQHPEKPIFEFYRNKYFTEFITGKISRVMNTVVPLHQLPTFHFQVPEKYMVIFPGSRSKSRTWPIANFVTVADHLFLQYQFTAIVCGAAGDAAYTQDFCNRYTHPMIDITGKTSLAEMLCLLQNAQCLLSVDTGSVHLAASVGCTVFGIFNGSQYKRFAPYPTNMAPNFYAIYPDDVEKELANADLVKQKYEFVVAVPYASVNPEKVILTAYQHYTKK